MQMSGQLHALAALTLGKEPPGKGKGKNVIVLN
jgi:hypothetical protein